MRSVRLLARLLVAVIICGIGLQTAAPVSAAGQQGLQAGWAIDDAGGVGFAHGLQRQLPLIESAGAGWVRINFRLGAAYSKWTKKGPTGRTALQQYDVLVDEARSRGLRVLGLVSNESLPGRQSDWVASNAEHTGGRGDNAYVRKFSRKAFLTLARHFQGRIEHWEIWNEPNAWTSSPRAGVYEGGTFIYPSNFAWLLRRVFEDARRNGLSELTIVSGGLFAHDLDGSARPGGARQVKRGDYGLRGAPSSQVSGAEYLAAVYQQGRAKAGWDSLKQSLGSYPLDAIGQHLYVDLDRATSQSKLRSYLDALHTTYLAHEGANTRKKLVITEFGWTTAFLTETLQAANLRTAYAAFRAAPFVQNAYWFQAQDIPEAGLYYGLQTGGDGPGYLGSPKPSLQAYREATAD